MDTDELAVMKKVIEDMYNIRDIIDNRKETPETSNNQLKEKIEINGFIFDNIDTLSIKNHYLIVNNNARIHINDIEHMTLGEFLLYPP